MSSNLFMSSPYCLSSSGSAHSRQDLINASISIVEVNVLLRRSLSDCVSSTIKELARFVNICNREKSFNENGSVFPSNDSIRLRASRESLAINELRKSHVEEDKCFGERSDLPIFVMLL